LKIFFHLPPPIKARCGADLVDSPARFADGRFDPANFPATFSGTVTVF
jgi:membrane carboxypeptidase/penicillin-binding protein PbpC